MPFPNVEYSEAPASLLAEVAREVRRGLPCRGGSFLPDLANLGLKSFFPFSCQLFWLTALCAGDVERYGGLPGPEPLKANPLDLVLFWPVLLEVERGGDICAAAWAEWVGDKVGLAIASPEAARAASPVGFRVFERFQGRLLGFGPSGLPVTAAISEILEPVWSG